MKPKCYPVLLYSGRLVARTLPFQGGEAGSKPVRSTNFALVSLVVEVLFCNQGVEVRFLPGAPIFGIDGTIESRIV